MHDLKSQSNEALMLAYGRGDARALPELFRRYAPLIYALGRRHLGSDSMAQDLVQHTFLRLHTARRDFSGDRKLHPFLMTITMNLVRDEWRRQRRRPTEALLVEPADSPPEHDPDQDRKLRILREAMAELSDNDRLIIELHWFQERDFPEIADILGISQGAARVRAHRASARLRKSVLNEDQAADGSATPDRTASRD